jgi:hypothetical protein
VIAGACCLAAAALWLLVRADRRFAPTPLEPRPAQAI